jgi:acetyl esterase
MIATKNAPATIPGVVLEPPAQSFAEVLASGDGPPLYTLSPEAARAVLDQAQAGAVAMAPASIQERTILGGPGVSVSITIVRPIEATGILPVVVYVHGGGWVLGNFGTHQRLVRDLVVQTGAAFVFVNYTPSPDAQYPVAIEQAYAALTWVAEHGKEIGVDGSRLAIAGDSVGGNMATAVTMLAKERSGPAICYQALFYPVTHAAFDTGSYNEFDDGPWLTRKAMQWFWDLYAPDAADRMEPTASPLLATLEQLKDLPPALVITDEADVLRDEGEAYSRKLRAAGVDVTSARYEGVFHDFMMLNALSETNAAKAAIAQAAQALKGALNHP